MSVAHPLLLVHVEGGRSCTDSERRPPALSNTHRSPPELRSMTRSRAHLEDGVDRQRVRLAACLPTCKCHCHCWWLAVALAVVLLGASRMPQHYPDLSCRVPLPIPASASVSALSLHSLAFLMARAASVAPYSRDPLHWLLRKRARIESRIDS